MKHHLVSIILPTYGRPLTVKKAIHSALNQTYKNIEIVVVDDNDPESSERAATEELMAIFEGRIKYVKQDKNRGGAAARNVGVKYSSGDYICFLDDDDTFHPEKVELQLQHLIECNLDISLCYINVKVEEGYGEGVAVRPIAQNTKEFVLQGNFMNGMVMLKREIFLKVGGFKIIPRFQDHILMFDLMALNPRVGILAKELYFANIHFGSRVSNSVNSKEAYEVRHGYENNYKHLLSDPEREFLSSRQKRSIFRCDMDAAFAGAKLGVIWDFVWSAKNVSGFISNFIFVLRYIFSRSAFLQRVKYYLKSLHARARI